MCNYVTTVQLTGSSYIKETTGGILMQGLLRTSYANGKSHNITVTQNPDNESAAGQRRQLDQYKRWDFNSVSEYCCDPESNYQRYRSNSPYPRRNPHRHQSRSPSRRSPVRIRTDYSVVFEQLRTHFRTPMYSEHNSILQTTCGKIVEAIVRCMVRILGVMITLPDNARRP
ncbi:uncharacterized protein TNCV_2413721 [Trichonephila clavipes]|nr:uncharacterized protein TNCV_2413721 [Trichonephila clavipes]